MDIFYKIHNICTVNIACDLGSEPLGASGSYPPISPILWHGSCQICQKPWARSALSGLADTTWQNHQISRDIRWCNDHQWSRNPSGSPLFSCFYQAVPKICQMKSNIWLVVGQTPLKNMKVNWDDDIPYGERKNVPNHQPDICGILCLANAVATHVSSIALWWLRKLLKNIIKLLVGHWTAVQTCYMFKSRNFTLWYTKISMENHHV